MEAVGVMDVIVDGIGEFGLGGRDMPVMYGWVSASKALIRSGGLYVKNLCMDDGWDT
jgi:hypothetical protein